MRTVDSDLATYFNDDRIRLAFSFQSKYLGMSPFRCPSLFTILSFMEYEYGVYHPRGGTGAVMAAMARVARDLGAKHPARTTPSRKSCSTAAAPPASAPPAAPHQLRRPRRQRRLRPRP